MTNENIIYVKNIHKAGKTTFNSKYGELHIENRCVKGSQVYVLLIEGVNKGITRSDPIEIWNWCAEYLGCKVYETPKKQPKPVRSPRKRKVYK